MASSGSPMTASIPSRSSTSLSGSWTASRRAPAGSRAPRASVRGARCLRGSAWLLLREGLECRLVVLRREQDLDELLGELPASGRRPRG